MNTKKLFFSVAFLTISLFCAAQQSYDEGFGNFNPGTNGLTIGSETDHTYSALLINGPLLPMYGSCTRDIVFKFRSAGKSIIRAWRGGNWNTYLEFMTTPDAGKLPLVRMHISENGNVGIGTINPKNKLDVNGTIRGREVKVESTGWSDFVFEEDYELPSLDEVATHIKEKKHLPGIPSAKEVEENGINLGEMDAKLLQKIEELTLYMIDLKEQNKEMKEEINILKNQLK